MKLCPVAAVTGPPGRAPGQKDLCSFGSEDNAQTFDPMFPARRLRGHWKGHRKGRFMLCAFSFPDVLQGFLFK